MVFLRSLLWFMLNSGEIIKNKLSSPIFFGSSGKVRKFDRDMNVNPLVKYDEHGCMIFYNTFVDFIPYKRKKVKR